MLNSKSFRFTIVVMLSRAVLCILSPEDLRWMCGGWPVVKSHIRALLSFSFLTGNVYVENKSILQTKTYHITEKCRTYTERKDGAA
jgi:hypothetical protein